MKVSVKGPRNDEEGEEESAWQGRVEIPQEGVCLIGCEGIPTKDIRTHIPPMQVRIPPMQVRIPPMQVRIPPTDDSCLGLC